MAAGWRAEVNVPGHTQVRPDLVAPVLEGPYGPGAYFVEYERWGMPSRAETKLGPYRRMAQLGRGLPILVVCDTERAEETYLTAGGGLPLLTATLKRALAGPLTGGATVWRSAAPAGPVALHCRRPGPRA